MTKFFIIIAFAIFTLSASAQSFTSSNLPIVIITTDKNPETNKPYDISDEPKVLANMKIIYHTDGSRNYVNEQNNALYLNYNGKIGIEIRGSSSSSLDKKPYGFTTLKNDNISNNNVSLLGIPKENDWILNALAFDESLIRDCLSFNLARSMGNYASATRYCEVIINGEYRGLYLLMEKVKIDENRIDISKMDVQDISLPYLSGGYVTKSDKTTGNDPVAWYMQSYSWDVNFIHHSPKPEEITEQQHNYIYSIFESLENATYYNNDSQLDGFPSIIDIPSFIDFIIINELASNVDGYQLSTYFHKDRNGKLRAGPIWDFNLTYGNDLIQWGYDRSKTNVWQLSNGDNTGAKFWKDLYDNATFKCYLVKRWNQLNASNQALNYTKIEHTIDSLTILTAEASVREQAKWNSISNNKQNIADLKVWLKTRITWLNSNWKNYQSCSAPQLPPLVISKINYYPVAFSDELSDDLEFIAITNTSNNAQNLSGIYFSNLGLTYQFEYDTYIDAYQTIYLASNSATFANNYGFIPYGEFNRHLSNKSEKIILADSWGNYIDQVEYFDNSPWPEQANGKGAYLQLKDLQTDNNIASNWIASTNTISNIINNPDVSAQIFPNPTKNKVTIQSNNLLIKSYSIIDPLGNIVIPKTLVNSQSNTINLEFLNPNIYFITIELENGKQTISKLVKL